MRAPDEAARRAARLLRWYPKAWRSRYGEEFAELLIADIGDRPRSRTRTADVVRGGMVARLAAAGFCGCPLEASAQLRASLTSLGFCTAIFAGFGAAMWSQLTVGWQWSEPDTAATTVAMVVMSAAMLAFAVLAVAAAVPVLWSAGSGLARGRHPGPARAGGARRGLRGDHVRGRQALRERLAGHGRPPVGPAGPGARRGGGVLVGVDAVRFLLLGPSRRPGRLSRRRAGLDGAEPAGHGRPDRRGGRAGSPDRALARVLDFETRLGTAACAAMAVFLGGCCAWIVDGGPGPRNLFHVGAIDASGAVVLTIAFVAARQAARMARLAAARLAAARLRGRADDHIDRTTPAAGAGPGGPGAGC